MAAEQVEFILIFTITVFFSTSVILMINTIVNNFQNKFYDDILYINKQIISLCYLESKILPSSSIKCIVSPDVQVIYGTKEGFILKTTRDYILIDTKVPIKNVITRNDFYLYNINNTIYII